MKRNECRKSKKIKEKGNIIKSYIKIYKANKYKKNKDIRRVIIYG